MSNTPSLLSINILKDKIMALLAAVYVHQQYKNISHKIACKAYLGFKSPMIVLQE